MKLPGVELEGVHCQLSIERPRAGVVVLRLAGWDAGEFGDLPMRELARDLAAHDTIELFVDARAVKGATTDVSGDWARWLNQHRSRFRHISMLPGSRLIQVTARFVREFADLADVMKIYTDGEAFDAALREAVGTGK
jgi:hypothetical protein